MTRRALAAVALALAAAPAGALSIRPPSPQAIPVADGRFVLLYLGGGGTARLDDDIAAARDRQLPPGMYRRGEWDAPVWPLPPELFGLDRLYPAADGVHLAVVPFHSGIGNLYAGPPFTPADYAAFRNTTALLLFARGKFVRKLVVADVARDPEKLKDESGLWLGEVTLDAAAGVVRVTARDGNRTAFALATGERVAGVGAGPPPFPVGVAWGWWAAAGVGAVGGAAALARRRRRRACSKLGA